MRRMQLYKTFLAPVFFLLPSVLLRAQDAAKEATQPVAENGDAWLFYGMTTAFGFLLLLLLIVMFRLKGLNPVEGEERLSLRGWWARVDEKLFTKAVPVEKEADILLDHDYDGIKELDNALPPWWKYGFYVTVVVAVVYMLHFHVWGTGASPEEEYKTEMSLAARQLDEYRKQSNDMVDETTVTMADAAGIAEGAKIYAQSCAACHGGKGEGGVGPNLTDEYWLHGGIINDVFKTIRNGVPKKGMPAWEKTFSPSQIKNISSYIKSLKGSNPPNGKAPQGDLFTEGTAAVK